MDGIFSPVASEAGNKADNKNNNSRSRTIDSEASMEVTASRSDMENRTPPPAFSPRRHGTVLGPASGTGVLPRRTPVKTNIGSPPRRSEARPMPDIARKLDFANLSAPDAAITRFSFDSLHKESEGATAPKSNALKPLNGNSLMVRGSKKQKNAKTAKPFSIVDYDVLDEEEQDERMSSEPINSETSFQLRDDYEDQQDHFLNSAEEEESVEVEDLFETKMREYRKVQEREQRESEVQLKSLSEKSKNGTSTSKEPTSAVTKKKQTAKRTFPSRHAPVPEIEDESEQDEEGEQEDEAEAESELESASESESESEPEPEVAYSDLSDLEDYKPSVQRHRKSSSTALSEPKTTSKTGKKNKSTVESRATKAKSVPKSTKSRSAKESSASQQRAKVSLEKPSEKASRKRKAVDDRESTSTRGKSGFVELIREQNGSDNPNVRRSKRTHIQPLAYWRNERIVYEQERDPETAIKVPKATGVFLVDSPHTVPAKVSKSRSTNRHHAEKEEEEEEDNEPPLITAEVNDVATDTTVSQREFYYYYLLDELFY